MFQKIPGFHFHAGHFAKSINAATSKNRFFLRISKNHFASGAATEEAHSLQIEKRRRNSWADPSSHARFFDSISKNILGCQFTTASSTKAIDASSIAEFRRKWQEQMSPALIRQLGGASLLRKYYAGSLHAALKAIYPSVEWPPPWTWKRKKKRAAAPSSKKKDDGQAPREKLSNTRGAHVPSG